MNKTKVDAELRSAQDYDRKIEAAKAFIKQCQTKHSQLEVQLQGVSDPTIHNQIVGQMNILYLKAKDAHTQQRELEEKGGKYGVTVKADFVDQMVALNAKAEATNAKYTELAADADVKAAIDKVNETAKPHMKLGPSAAFAAAFNQLKAWRKDIESESIPLYEDGGVNAVDVLLNGETHRMILDSGASTIMLPAELAEELKMVPGEKDRPVQMTIADGSTIMGHEMTLKSVRVGRFAMENVICVVLDHTPNKAPALLGNTFLSHFIIKLDSKGGALHLTEVSKDDKLIIKTTGGAADPKKPAGKSGGKTPDEKMEK